MGFHCENYCENVDVHPENLGFFGDLSNTNGDSSIKNGGRMGDTMGYN